LAEKFNKKLKEYFQQRRNISIPPDKGFTPASVAVILNFINSELSLFFIKRTENPGDSYSGHVAFPGGKMNDGDSSSVETALRETNEEIGVSLNDSGYLLGRLDDLKPLNPNGPKFLVSPFVFILNKNIDIKINKSEVENFMWIPFDYLADKNNLRIRYKERSGYVIEDYVYSYQDYLVWGMTGRIVNSFIKEVSVII